MIEPSSSSSGGATATAGAARSREARSGSAMRQWAGGNSGHQQQMAAPLAQSNCKDGTARVRAPDRRGSTSSTACAALRAVEVGDVLAVEIGTVEHGRGLRTGGPDPAEMGLAAARRAIQRQRRRRPVGPAVDPGHRLAIAGGDGTKSARA